MQWPPQPAVWPLAEWSRQILAAGHKWHVQVLGQGPALLLIHGAGGAGQSWSYVAEMLADQFTLVIPDLPGQGFSKPGKPHRFGLNEMAQDLATLMVEMDITPHGLVGHSAGGAIALRMAQQGLTCPVAAVNPALAGFDGVAGWLYPRMAKTMAHLPFTAALFSKLAGTPEKVAQLLEATGSAISPQMAERYLQLIQDTDHVNGTLKMMAAWDLQPVLRNLAKLENPCLFLLGGQDRTVPPATARSLAAKLGSITAHDMPDHGHLAHEEDPALVARQIERFFKDPSKS